MIDSGFGVGGCDRCVWKGVWKLSEAFCGGGVERRKSVRVDGIKGGNCERVYVENVLKRLRLFFYFIFLIINRKFMFIYSLILIVKCQITQISIKYYK